MAVLRSLTGSNPELIPLTGATIILGRHPECDIVLDVGAVSRQHARILQIGDSFFLEDMHSRNGTLLNDKRIETRHQLNEGDEINICDIAFSFHLGVPAPLPPKPPQSPGPVVMVDDAKQAASGTTVMSKLEVCTGSTGLRLSVNAEVKLKALVEIGRNLSTAVCMEDVLPKLLDNLFTIFIQADRGFILLKEPGTDRMIPKAVKFRREGGSDQIRISRTILHDVTTNKEAILSADAAADGRFDLSESIVDLHIHSIMCAPLLDSRGNVLGVIEVDTLDQRRRFSHDDLDVLAAVASQSAMAVENAQMHEQRLQEELIRRELELAHRVQQTLLPAGPPQVPGYEFFDFYEPARHLGGDYYDYIPLSAGRLAIVVGDVSGKGVAASLFMAKLSADARYCLATAATPVEAITRLNKTFCQDRWEGRFITFVVAVLDPASHDACIINAGHPLPLVRRTSGGVDELGRGDSGLPLGIDENSSYHPFSVPIAAGEVVSLHTDGVTDAEAPSTERYGDPRLQAQLALSSQNCEDVAQRVLDDVRRFIGANAQADDMCMVCMRRLA